MKYLLIDSRDRLANSVSSSDCTFQLVDGSLIFKMVKLLHFQVPNTLYNITSTNNKLTFNDGTNPYTVTIPVGNYNIVDLIGELETLMNATASSHVFDITYDEKTYKVTIEETSGPSNFSLLFSTGDDQMFKELGFAQIDLSAAATYTSSKAIDLSGQAFVYLDFSFLGDQIRTTNQNDSPSFVVPLVGSNGELEISNPENSFEQELNAPVIVNHFSVKLKGRDGTTLDFNGAEWSCLLGYE